MERNFQINWPAIVKEAQRRRRAQGLTQRRLAALAKVSPPTISRFEQNRQNIELSSVMSILKALGMTEQEHEGSLLIRRDSSSRGGQPQYVVMFAPYEGSGGALEPKAVSGEDSLRAFWNEIGIEPSAQRLALANLIQGDTATIPNVLFDRSQIKQYWPNQQFR